MDWFTSVNTESWMVCRRTPTVQFKTSFFIIIKNLLKLIWLIYYNSCLSVDLTSLLTCSIWLMSFCCLISLVMLISNPALSNLQKWNETHGISFSTKSIFKTSKRNLREKQIKMLACLGLFLNFVTLIWYKFKPLGIKSELKYPASPSYVT